MGEDRVLTAVCLILAAIELAILQANPSLFRRVKVSQVPGILVGLAGLLTTALYAIALITRQEPSLERIQVLNLLWSQANRMALLAAIFFLLNGCALSLLSRGSRRATNIAHFLMIPGAMIGYVVLISYLFGVQALHGWLNVPVALNTGIAFCALSVAMFCVRPDTWLMSVFQGDHSGSVVARRLLPAIMGIPLLIGWLHLYLERSVALLPEVNMALAAVVVTFTFLFLVWLNAASLNRSDSKRQLVEKALMSSRERFRLAFENANIGMALVGLDGRYLRVNEALSEMLGYTQLEMEKMGVRDLTYPEDLKISRDFRRRSLLSEIGSAQFEKRKVHRNGTSVWVHIASSLVRDFQGNPLYFVSQVEDITVRKQAEKELRLVLEELEQRVQERTAELRETVAQLQQEVTERQQAEQVIRKSEAKLRRLTQRVLALQENERQQISWELQEDLAQYITALKLELRTFESKLSEGDATLRQNYRKVLNKINVIVDNLRRRAMDLSPQLLADLGLTVSLKSMCENFCRIHDLKCDLYLDELNQRFNAEASISIYRVFEEALENIAQYAAATKVIISAKTRDSEVEFIVEDNGQGFDPAIAEAHQGIGLSAMAERVRALGGTFKLESQIGAGTSISFVLPRTRKRKPVSALPINEVVGSI